MELVCADHFIVGTEEEKNEKLVDDAEIGVGCVRRVGVVDVNEKSESIRVLLTLISVILRWAETDERCIVCPDGDASIAVIEERRNIRRKDRCFLARGHRCIRDVRRMTATCVHDGWKCGQLNSLGYFFGQILSFSSVEDI